MKFFHLFKIGLKITEIGYILKLSVQFNLLPCQMKLFNLRNTPG